MLHGRYSTGFKTGLYNFFYNFADIKVYLVDPVGISDQFICQFWKLIFSLGMHFFLQLIFILIETVYIAF